MASSSCGCLLLTKCVRRLNGLTRRTSFTLNPRLSSWSRSLFIRSSVVLQSQSKCQTLWQTQRWNGTVSSVQGAPSTDPKPNAEPQQQQQQQPPPPSTEQNTTSSGKEEDKKKAANLQWKATKYTLIGLSILFSCSAGWMLIVWGSPQKDEDGKEIKDEFTDMPIVKAYLYRAWRELLFYNKMIQDPSRDKLLPDPLKEPYYQPPYTLVIEMTDVLVHPDWTYKTGWRFKKRPGVDFFLQQVGPPLFEIVIYTSEQGFTAYPILESLDPNGFIMYKLFRDATRYHNGHHVKDLSCLNRDLSKVILVDWDEKSFQLQPDNALRLKKWAGNDDDSTLFDLAVFLRTMVSNDVEDVRTVLQFYKQFDDPMVAFKENQRRLQEEQDRFNQQKVIGSERPASLVQSWSSGLFGRRR